MRKIPSNLENPLDSLLIDLSEPISKYFHTLYMNPNDITTFSLIFGIISILFLYKEKPVLASACYFLSYLFDVVDGYYARKYRMVTKFGDMYDHIKDWTVNITYMYVLFNRNKQKLKTWQWILVSCIFIFLLGMQALYFSAQEKYYNKIDTIPSLAWLSGLIKTKEEAIKTLKWTRFFGCGTFITCVIIFTIWIEYKK
jgi:phosphatidylglycerophosphate synthase